MIESLTSLLSRSMLVMKMLFCFSLIAFVYFGCISTDEKMNGERLAKVHCSSCHAYPKPELLDHSSWKDHILPRMGYMMGVLPKEVIGFEFIEQFAEQKAFTNPQIFRKESQLSISEWSAIEKFYLDESPAIVDYKQEIVVDTLNLFDLIVPSIKLHPPSTTMVKFSDQQLIFGDANSKRLYSLDKELELDKAANLKEGIVDITELPEQYLTTVMGSFSPTDHASGQIIILPKSQEQHVQILLDSLQRPVDASYADLNEDGRMDIITCEYGKWLGSLSWWTTDSLGLQERHVLRDMPGAIKSYPYDWNQDGRMDVIALFGQGDEGIFIFYNEGNGNFRTAQVLRFPPSYGSSSFRLFDFNKDGFLDIIYTAGDNADFPPIVKPYHGIYIFLNDGHQTFEQKYFYPMIGAYDAIPADYDNDGDIDIAAISFFPDYSSEQPLGFMYLQNDEGNNFSKSTFRNFEMGRWIVMDAADWDSDGDVDLVLGSFTFETIPEIGLVQKWNDGGLPFIVLDNTLQ